MQIRHRRGWFLLSVAPKLVGTEGRQWSGKQLLLRSEKQGSTSHLPPWLVDGHCSCSRLPVCGSVSKLLFIRIPVTQE